MPFVQATPITIDTKLIGKQLDEFMDHLDGLMSEGANEMHRLLSEEPPNKHIPWNKVGESPPAYKTYKQQYFVIKGVRDGTLNAPYQRSHTLSEAWKVTKNRLPKQINYLISNEEESAQYIYDTAKRVYRAKAVGWPTVENIANKEWPKEAKKIEQAAGKWKPS